MRPEVCPVSICYAFDMTCRDYRKENSPYGHTMMNLEFNSPILVIHRLSGLAVVNIQHCIYFTKWESMSASKIGACALPFPVPFPFHSHSNVIQEGQKYIFSFGHIHLFLLLFFFRSRNLGNIWKFLTENIPKFSFVKESPAEEKPKAVESVLGQASCMSDTKPTSPLPVRSPERGRGAPPLHPPPPPPSAHKHTCRSSLGQLHPQLRLVK